MAWTYQDEILFIVVDGQKTNNPTMGMTFVEQIEFLESLSGQYKVKHACNLDGGGSSALYINGNLVNKPTDPSRKIGNTFILFDNSLSSGKPLNEKVYNAQLKHQHGFQEMKKKATCRIKSE